MELEKVVKMDKKYYMNTFGDRTPVCFDYGKGIKLWDANGQKYFDFLGGIAVNILGHAHPALVRAICKQAEKLIHCSSLYYIKTQAKLAKVLAENSCTNRVFFCNSGAEANEGAIKLARLYYRKKGIDNKYEIITLKKSFHGRTMTTLSATGQEKYQKPLTPLTPGFKHVEINNINELENEISENTCAVMLEPIQGESGVNPLSVEFMKGVRRLCDEKDLLLVLDEIQTGIGRTGKLFGYEHFGIEPDIFTLAKALGGGFPIGAVCAKEEAAAAFEPGDHGSTFGGNPLACAAALSVMETIEKEELLANCTKMGEYFFEKLEGLKDKHSLIGEIRGKGLMIGIELNEERAATVKDKCLKQGYLVGSVGTGIIRMLPPLIVTKKNIDGMIDVLDAALVAC